MEFLSQHFGLVRYEPDQVVLFPEGLPAFEEEREFLLLEQPETAPVIFLQSLRRPELAFITLPVNWVEPAYRLQLEPEDRAALGLTEEEAETAPHLLCVAIVTIRAEQPPTANLLAPVVVNLKSRRGRQVIQSGSAYSHEHPLILPAEEAPCS